MNIHRIKPLSEGECGKLSGGFISIEHTNLDAEGIYNGNCSSESGWINRNCGCRDCNSSSGTLKG